jgi:hypothetical protein
LPFAKIRRFNLLNVPVMRACYAPTPKGCFVALLVGHYFDRRRRALLRGVTNGFMVLRSRAVAKKNYNAIGFALIKHRWRDHGTPAG